MSSHIKSYKGDDPFLQQVNDVYSAYYSMWPGTSKSAALLESVINSETQKEINDKNIEQSEKAYQRSTVSAQIEQFIKAGFSEQQARQIVAGAANPGAYTPAQLQAPVMSGTAEGVAADQQNTIASVQTGLGAAQQAIATTQQIAQSYFDGLDSPSGGAIGAFTANPVVSKLTAHLDEIAPEYRSVFGLNELAKSGRLPESLKSIIESEDYKRAMNSPYARKYLDSFFAQSFQFSRDQYALTSVDLSNQVARVKVLREDLQLGQDSQKLMQMQLETDYATKVQSSKIKMSMSMFDAQAAEYELNKQKFLNPEYRQKWLAHMLQDETNAQILGTILEKKYSKQSEWLDDPANAQFVAVGELLDAMGITSTDVGAVLSYSMAATGLSIPAASQSILDRLRHWIFD